jgi:hypothetical protein
VSSRCGLRADCNPHRLEDTKFADLRSAVKKSTLQLVRPLDHLLRLN